MIEPAFKREIPVYRRTAGTLRVNSGDVYILDNDGNITWVYLKKDHGKIGIATCARSGSRYMYKVLKELGYNVGHEKWEEDGSVGYHLAAVQPDNCLHQVRHPLKQIASMLSHRAWGFAEQAVTISNYDLLGCMQYWYKWNFLCESFCVWRYQIEKIDDVWDKILEHIGHEKCDIPDVPRDTNKSKNAIKEVTWEDLLSEDEAYTERILEMAKRYGYEVPEMDKIKYQNLGELETAQVTSV